MKTEVIQQSEVTSSEFSFPQNEVLKPVRVGFYSFRQSIVSGIKFEFIQLRIRYSILKIIFRQYRNPKTVYTIMKTFHRLRRKLLGPYRIRKVASIEGKYYWDLYTPGFGSRAFDNFFLGEAARIVPTQMKTNRFTNIFIAVTKKCPLQCEHCVEWESLNKKEKLNITDLKKIVLTFQNYGTSLIQLTGGEPLLKVNDLVELIGSAKPETDFWILTSGYNLTLENAQRLKRAGLTGVVISLDHFDPNQHNQFRGFKDSFDWVKTAVKNSISTNLVTALSICVTRSFVSDSNLMTYAKLAKRLGVAFVQLLEPRAVGHYSGMDVTLTREHERILEDFYLKMNYNKKYAEYPIVTYHGYHQRQIGCFGSGNRNLYVDTDGDLHACPFCQTKMGSALSKDADAFITTMQSVGCHTFRSYSN
jgi:MoaA/NifB/PqqE/SkfB family radical SAM enzyme